MAFSVSKIFWWGLNPGNLLLLALVLASLAVVFRWRRIATTLVLLTTSVALAIAVLPIRDWLLVPLEHRFPQPRPPERVDGIVVLGGGLNSDLSARVGQVVLNDAAERLVTFATLARHYPEARLLFSGGSANLIDDSAREADFAKTLMVDLGVPAERVLIERDSRNTEENARFSKDLVKPQTGEIWLLVTSAYHMPRSVGVFRRAGWTVVPYPVDYGVPAEGWRTPAGLLDGLTAVNWAVKEWVGLFYYRIMGYTDELFPRP